MKGNINLDRYVLLLLATCAIYLASKIDYGHRFKKKKFFLFIAMAILFFFMAMRSISVGADTRQYCAAFKQIHNLRWADIFTANIYGANSRNWILPLESGYRLYNKIIAIFSSNTQTITIINSLLIIGINYFLIKRNSKNPMLSVWLYITLGVYQTQMNVTRNAIAILIVYLSFSFIEQKKFLNYSLCVLLAVTIHTSTIVLIVLYWLINVIKITKKKINIIFGTALLFASTFSNFRTYLIGFVPTRYRLYFMASGADLEVMAVGLVHIGLVVLVFLGTQKSARGDILKSESIGVWMLILDICSYVMAFSFSLATRLAGLFGPYLIYFIPSVIERGITEKKEKRLFTFLVVVFCGIQYIVRLHFNNIGSTMPYLFFWEEI